MKEALQLPSPLQKLEIEIAKQKNIQIYLKRDDLIHPSISGNKWRKLKYNIQQAQQENKQTLLTFGGAFSNHISATAATGKMFGLKTIGIIRGEEHQPLNKTLQFATDCGMQLFYVDREKYRKKNNLDFQALIPDFDKEKTYILPEGGANALAIKGCAEIVDELNTPFDYIVCACGTGTTIAGIATNLQAHQQAIGIAVLKNEHLEQEIRQQIPSINARFSILPTRFGAYAKTTPELINFIKQFYSEHHILLDYVYTGKMMLTLFQLIEEYYFPENSTIIAIHTGGTKNANVFDVF